MTQCSSIMVKQNEEFAEEITGLTWYIMATVSLGPSCSWLHIHFTRKNTNFSEICLYHTSK